MKIAVIGAGFTGLSASLILQNKGHQVKIFEKDSEPGGLAIGFKAKGWRWTLEKHYHHWFANDKFILNLAKRIDYQVVLKRPATSVYVDGEIYQLDSPTSVLTFPKLSLTERLRMAATLGFLRFNPFWKPLEKYSSTKTLPALMGENSYNMLWKPQLYNKFGDYAPEVSLAWFWARIKKRTSTLAYPEGGYLSFAQTLDKRLKSLGAKADYNTDVLEILEENEKLVVSTKSSNSQKVRSEEFDRVLMTLPTSAMVKIVKGLPDEYKQNVLGLKGLGAINLVLRLRKPFLPRKTYWLSVCDPTSPVMAIVEHTNFMDKKYYNNEHIVYLGNYLPNDHRYFSLSEHDILNQYDSFLQKIHKNYQKNVIALHAFKAPFAQPIIPLNYSKKIPAFKTPLKNLYLANMQQVYPWDRGTNYAVEVGEKVASIMLDEI